MTVSESQRRAVYKYAKTHLKRIPLNVQLEEFDVIKAAADRAGQPVNTFIKQAIAERIARDAEQEEQNG